MADEKKTAVKQPPDGFIWLKGSNCSVDGIEYLAENGVLTVPIDIGAFLMKDHQLEPV